MTSIFSWESDDPADWDRCCSTIKTNTNSISSKNLKWRLLSFYKKVIPARSCRIQYLAKRRKPSPWGEEPVRADEGRWETLISGPHPPSEKVPPHPEGEDSWLYHGFCDSAQNDRNFETAIFVFKEWSFQWDNPFFINLLIGCQAATQEIWLRYLIPLIKTAWKFLC